MHRLSDEQLTTSGLFLCRQCEECICESDSQFKTHHERVHVQKRSVTNKDIVTKHLFSEVSTIHHNHWDEGLSFLSTTTFSQATFRQTLITHIKDRLEQNVLRAYYDVLTCCVEAHKSASNAKLSKSSDFDPTPIWILPFVFERLVLAPNPNKNPDPKKGETINQLVNERIRLFRSGQIQLLYEESNAIKSRTPAEQAAKPVSKLNSAQIAADLDNFKSANARATKETPVALIDDDNIQTCHNLHPKSLNLGLYRPRRSTRTALNNRKGIIISPNDIKDIFTNLKRGKASGNELDSLDIFIKILATNARRRKARKDVLYKTEVLSQFFTIIANGTVPQRIKSILRTTYMVAFHKDITDKTKLRPLGIPSAIRRITAVAILHKFKGDFATHLLPFNYAFGVNGGIDIITSTMRLGVEQYMHDDNSIDGKLPSRALVSLDIRNMFNAISREKMRELIFIHFPELEPFADCLYDDFGQTLIKRSDGTFESIPVEEGFSQGCPASPVFAALVLNRILQKVYADMLTTVKNRVANYDTGDDGRGGVPIIMSYVDDVNALIPLSDVETFLTLFNKYGAPWGAIMNTEKTRIMTTTSGHSLTDRLCNSVSNDTRLIGQSLKRAISQFSNEIVDGINIPYEEVNGLRVLGAPIGSHTFCNDFILKMMSRALEASRAIATSLDSKQTIMQLFKICTLHKMTHLFASDVVNSDITDLPDNWNVWQSDMTDRFTEMLEEMICTVTNRPTIPRHSRLLATMSVSTGGLGLQHPMSAAIPTFILQTKRNLQYMNTGVWVSDTLPPVTLPPHITSLFSNWKTSSSHTFTIFRQYYSTIADVCVSDEFEGDKTEFFINKSGINTCRERVSFEAGRRTKILVKHELRDDMDSLIQLEDLLDPKMSSALLDMSRLNVNARRKNDDFTVMLKRKLRLELWFDDMICFCKRRMDNFGDHCLSCRSHCKGTMSNKVRDGVIKLLKPICTTVNLIDSDGMITSETPRVIPGLPNKRPFDLSINFDHMLNDNAWRCTLSRLGFDVVFVPTKNKNLISVSTDDARSNEYKMRLRDGERDKFQREGASCKETGITLSGDDMIGSILKNNMGFVPIAMTAHGRMGSLIERVLYGTDALPPPDFMADRPHAAAAWRVATSPVVPRGILARADTIWRSQHPNKFYGGSHRATTPSMWFNKQLGLVISTSVSAHLIRAHNKNKSKKPVRCGADKDCPCDPHNDRVCQPCTIPTSPTGVLPTGNPPQDPAVDLT